MDAGFPTNLTSRQELQTTVLRCNSLLRETKHPELRAGLHELAAAAATVDAILAEIPAEVQTDKRFKRIFEGGSTWQPEWADNKTYYHTAHGVFFLSLGQQCIMINGRAGFWVGCRRFRLRLGEEPYRYSTNLAQLRPYAEEYIDKFVSCIPATKEDLLIVFADVDNPEVKAHAVC